MCNNNIIYFTGAGYTPFQTKLPPLTKLFFRHCVSKRAFFSITRIPRTFQVIYYSLSFCYYYRFLIFSIIRCVIIASQLKLYAKSTPIIVYTCINTYIHNYNYISCVFLNNNSQYSHTHTFNVDIYINTVIRR